MCVCLYTALALPPSPPPLALSPSTTFSSLPANVVEREIGQK